VEPLERDRPPGTNAPEGTYGLGQPYGNEWQVLWRILEDEFFGWEFLPIHGFCVPLTLTTRKSLERYGTVQEKLRKIAILDALGRSPL
jgi:hypothetical protein